MFCGVQNEEFSLSRVGLIRAEFLEEGNERARIYSIFGKWPPFMNFQGARPCVTYVYMDIFMYSE